MEEERVILHSDLNSFYASVEMLHNPSLQGKNVAVCGSVEDRHGIVLAANPGAKQFGVRTGDAVWQAEQKCRDLVVVEPHMDRYVRFSRMARRIYSDYSGCVEPYGLDENWIALGSGQDGRAVADEIRRRVRKELGVTVSVGVSFNKSMAKLGSDYKKPDATTVITRDNFREFVWPMPVSDLLFVGPQTAKKLKKMWINTIGQLAGTPRDMILDHFGKHGLVIWNYANGRDDDPVTPTGYVPAPKSIGNSTTAPRDLETPEDIRVTAMILAESVAERMRKDHYRCKTVQISIRYASMATFLRQAQLPFPCCTARRIGDLAMKLILDNWTGDPLRSIGVRGCNLEKNEYPQLSLLPELREEQRQEDLETAVQDLRRRFGHFCIQRGIMAADRQLSDLDTQREDSAQSVAFFRG